MEHLRAAFERHLAAFNGRDLDGLLAGFTVDATWVTGNDSFRGHGEQAELFRGAFAVAPVLRVVAVLVDGDRVAAEPAVRIVPDGGTHDFAIAARFGDRRDLAAR